MAETIRTVDARRRHKTLVCPGVEAASAAARRGRRARTALLLCGLVGCVRPGPVYRCDEHQRCPEGMCCRDGLCVPQDGDGGSGDGTAGQCTWPLTGHLQGAEDLVTADLDGESQLFALGCDDRTVAGADHVFALQVESRAVVELSVSPAIEAVVALRTACEDPSSELACERWPSWQALREVLQPGLYYVLVALPAAEQADTYTLHLASWPVAAHASCEAAQPLEGSVALEDLVLQAGGEHSFECNGATSTQVENALMLYYAVRVPPEQALLAWCEPAFGLLDGNSSAQVALFDGCPASQCLDTHPLAARLLNSGARPLDAVLGVYGDRLQENDPFSLHTEYTDVPDNLRCGDAAPVSIGSAVHGNTVLGDPAPTCEEAQADSRAVYYRVQIPAQQTLAAELWDDDGAAEAAPAHALKLLKACDALRCLDVRAQDLPVEKGRRTLGYSNPGASPLDTVLVVESTASVAKLQQYGFTLALRGSPVVTNLHCADATGLQDGDFLRDQDGALAVEAVAAECQSFARGASLFYRVSVPAGAELQVLADGTEGATEPLLQLFEGCPRSVRDGGVEDATPPACLTAGTLAGDYTLRRLVWRNETAAARELNLTVSSVDASSAGLFDLAVSVGAAPYLSQSLPADCDDLTAAPTVPGLEEDDSSSPLTALPFAFGFFGRPVVAYSVTSEGYAQLWETSQGEPLATPINAPIPWPQAPNNLVAAFWDDLIQVAGGEHPSSIRAQTLGSAPERRLVIAWQDLRLASNPGTRLNVQLKLLEGSDAIELHYCALAPGSEPAVSGSRASIGLEDGNGFRGVQHSFNQASAVSSSSALRFVPVP